MTRSDNRNRKFILAVISTFLVAFFYNGV